MLEGLLGEEMESKYLGWKGGWMVVEARLGAPFLSPPSGSLSNNKNRFCFYIISLFSVEEFFFYIISLYSVKKIDFIFVLSVYIVLKKNKKYFVFILSVSMVSKKNKISFVFISSVYIALNKNKKGYVYSPDRGKNWGTL